MKTSKRKPRFGTMRGIIKIYDPDWWKPMTNKEVDDFIEGRYGDISIPPKSARKKQTKQ
jgi:hypothetical protein